MLPLSLSLYILAPSSLFLNPNRDFSSEIRLLPWSKFVKDLSRRFTAVRISRRCNEHKTRPCSLVLIRRCRHLPSRSSSFAHRTHSRLAVPLSFCSVSINDDTPKYFISRGPSRANGSSGRTWRKRRYNTLIVLRARAQSDGAHAIQDIDSEFRVSGAPRETINYAIIDPDWIIREI